MASAIPWFKKHPDWLEKELKSLSNLGIKFQVDNEARNAGILRISLEIQTGNTYFNIDEGYGNIKLTAVYPDAYPYFRPEVFAYEVQLPRHQNFIEKNLCLLPRSTESWEPELTLGQYLQEQLPKVISKGSVTDPEILKQDPHEQAEPANEFYTNYNTPVIFNNSCIPIDDSFNTNAVEVLGTFRVGVPKDSILPTRLAAVEIFDRKGNSLYKMPEELLSLFPARLTGVIVKLSQKPPTGNAAKDYKWLFEKLPNEQKKLLKAHELKLKKNTKLNRVIGVCFPEEVEPAKFGWGWIFLISGSHFDPIKSRNQVKYIPKEAYFYVPIARTGIDSMTVRIPELKPLSKKKIAVIGLGALGGTSAIEFARNGIGSLSILDFDVVEPATTVRWPLGISAAGLLKTEAIKNFIQLNYPETQVHTFDQRIGNIAITGNKQIPLQFSIEQDTLDKLLENVSLIFDATAEVGIWHYISKEAESRKIPYVSIYTTPGGFGGLVMRIVPDKTEGCWMCLQYSKGDSIPVPPSNELGKIQPPGCGDITFTGTNFDIQNISLAGVKLAIATLCSGIKGAYSDVSWDVAVAKLIDKNNNPTLPHWDYFPLKRHPKCPYCSSNV